MKADSVIGFEHLLGVVCGIEIIATVDPTLRHWSIKAGAVFDGGDVDFWKRDLEPEQLSEWRYKRHAESVQAAADNDKFAQRSADLLIYERQVLHNQDDIPALFPAMQHPVDQVLAALVLPFPRVEPCAAFIQHDQTVFGFIVGFIARPERV